MKFLFKQILFMFFMLFGICSCGNWYLEQDLGNGYSLFADPYEILYSTDDKHYEFVILPCVKSYAYDSSYIVAKTYKNRFKCDSVKYWIVDKNDKTSPKRTYDVYDEYYKWTNTYSIKGTVKGPFDSITYVKYVDSLNINLKLQDIAND